MKGADLLRTILVSKENEIVAAKKLRSLDCLKALTSERKDFRSFNKKSNLLIAEFKRHSPSHGSFNKNIETVLPVYEKYADIISVLTDKEFFHGDLNDLELARKLQKLPILRKDFIIDEYQIYESLIAGADYILLIARLLDRSTLSNFLEIASDLGLRVLLEVHNTEDLEKASGLHVDILGINNRDLDTLLTDINLSLKLADKLAADCFWISESGIKSLADAIYLKKYGAKGFLIGELFLKQANLSEYLESFVSGLQNES